MDVKQAQQDLVYKKGKQVVAMVYLLLNTHAALVDV
jgi:hypothetical protein